ncbi:hypothetical protein H7F33_08670 [Pedobacter sp. PAMC26386]|nr:hypothetical protein H7F33_08670 [Pedobacter sp. PAMC26386]
MKWTMENYPLEMKGLKPALKKKAIEIANQLKKDGKIRELAIVDEAIRLAQEWSLNKGPLS